MTSMRPVPAMYRVTQPFNGRFSTKFSGGSAHGAIDFATPIGTPVVAPDDGVIVFASWAWDLPGGANDWVPRWFQLKPAVGNTRGGGGIMTVLRNSAGSHWIFAHLSTNDIAPVGKRVRRGDIIGYTGTTGTSTGPHLHLGLVPARPNWGNGTFGSIDPMPWLTIPFAPNTYTSWTGAATSGTGSSNTTATTAGKDWSDMATEAEFRKIIREENRAAAEYTAGRAARKIMEWGIKGLGEAKGTMQFGQSQRHERDERAKNIAARAEVREALKVIAASQSQVLARLEALERDNGTEKESI